MIDTWLTFFESLAAIKISQQLECIKWFILNQNKFSLAIFNIKSIQKIITFLTNSKNISMKKFGPYSIECLVDLSVSISLFV